MRWKKANPGRSQRSTASSSEDDTEEAPHSRIENRTDSRSEKRKHPIIIESSSVEEQLTQSPRCEQTYDQTQTSLSSSSEYIDEAPPLVNYSNVTVRIPAQASPKTRINSHVIEDSVTSCTTPVNYIEHTEDLEGSRVQVDESISSALRLDSRVIPDSQSLWGSINSASGLFELSNHGAKTVIGIENSVLASQGSVHTSPSSPSKEDVQSVKQTKLGTAPSRNSLHDSLSDAISYSVGDSSVIGLLPSQPPSTTYGQSALSPQGIPENFTMTSSLQDAHEASSQFEGPQSGDRQELERRDEGIVRPNVDASLSRPGHGSNSEDSKIRGFANASIRSEETNVSKTNPSDKLLHPQTLHSSPVITSLRDTSRARQRSSSPAVRGRGSHVNSPARVRSPSPPLRACNLEVMVPVPLFDTPYHNYKNIFVYERNFLEDFMQTIPSEVTKQQLNKAQDVYRSLCDFTLHQDLISHEPFTQKSLNATQLAQWLTSISSKFRLLQLLFSALESDRSKIVAIFVKPGRAFTYVEDVLEGFDVSVIRLGDADPAESSNAHKPRVLLIDTGHDTSLSTSFKVDLIIGLDETFLLSDPLVQKLRQRPQDQFKPPALGLVVPYSLEHFVREQSGVENISDDIALIQRHLQGACQQRAKAGKFLPGMPRLEAMANSLAAAMIDPDKSLNLPTLDLFSLPSPIFEQSSPAFEGSNLRGAPVSNTRNVQEASIALQKNMQQHLTSSPAPKRPVDSEASPSQALKRPRMTPQLDQKASPTSLPEPTCIVDSTRKPSNYDQFSQAPPGRTNDMPSTATYERDSTRSFKAHQPRLNAMVVEDLKNRLEEAKRTEIQLRDQVKTHERTIAIYEPQRTELYHENQNLKMNLKEIAALHRTVTAVQNTNDDLRGKLKAANEESTKSHSLLVGATNPEVRELAELRAKAKECEGLKKKLETLSGECEYTRGLYREASTSAAALGEEVRNVTVRLEDAKHRLDSAEAHERSLLNETFAKTQISKAHGEIEQFQARLASRERLCRTICEERDRLREENELLKERVGVGLHTRASSQRASSVPGGQGLHGGGVGSKVGERARASHDLLRAAAANVAPASGGVGSRSSSRAGSRQGSRAASPGPNAKKGIQIKGSNLK